MERFLHLWFEHHATFGYLFFSYRVSACRSQKLQTRGTVSLRTGAANT